MKVLHVLQHSLPTLSGYTVRADALLRAQQALGVDVVALTGAVEQSSIAEETVSGVRYRRTDRHGERLNGRLREWRLYRLLKQRLREVVEEESPDLVHVHSPAYNALGSIGVAREYGLPCVYEVRATWEDAAVDRNKLRSGSAIYRLVQAIDNYAFRRAHAVVAICQGLRREIIARGVAPEKVLVVENGVEPERFTPAERDGELARSLDLGSGPVFGFLGSLFRYEGIEDLLNAVPYVVAQVPGVQFLIVGGGEREQQVRELVGQWAGTNTVIYRQRVPHSEIGAYYSVVDCLVYPRRSNRLTELVTPLKPLEAMAMGKLVLASAVGGHRELIEDGRTGILYPPGDITALTDALCRAVKDRDGLRALATAGREYVLEQRDWRVIARKYNDVYETARRNRNGQLLG